MTELYGVFLNEEFSRYVSECKRIAGLSSNPTPMPKRSVAAETYALSADWFSQILAEYYQTPKHYGTLPAN